MTDPGFLARVTAGGGNPDCLHCRLSVLIVEHLAAHAADHGGARPSANDVVAALAEMTGDMLCRAESPAFRLALFRQAVDLMAGRCGVEVVSPGAAAAPAHKLH